MRNFLARILCKRFLPVASPGNPSRTFGQFDRRVAFIGVLVFTVGFGPTGSRQLLLGQNRQTGTVYGVITDSSGAVIPNVSVSIVQSSTSESWKTTSDSQGRYEFGELPTGMLTVIAAKFGFRLVEEQIQVTLGQNVEQNLQLTIEPLEQSLVVAEEVRTEMETIPGSVALIPPTELDRSRAHNLEDVLSFTPGVLVRSRFGADEIQLSVRGSGLRNNFHHRGLNTLINGIPYSEADGFSDFESVDLLAAHRIELWKGANALRYGGNSMGGAVNFVTHTGETAPPFEIRAEGGSFGLFKGQLAVADVRGPFSYYLSLSETELDGYREHSEQGRQRLFSNLGWRLNPVTQLKLDISYSNVSEALPGSLTREEFLSNPRQADPENLAGRNGRFYNYVRLAVGLDHQIDARQELSVSVFGQYRDVDHPIFQILDQDQRNFGGEVRYSLFNTIGSRPNRLVAGFTPQIGGNGERRFENLGGAQRGARTAVFGTEARNYGFYFEDQLDVSSELTLILGGRADWAVRRFKDKFLSDGDRTDQRTFRVFSPKFGFVSRAMKGAQVFGNVSRSYEPPLMLELTSFGSAGFLDLDAQDTWQFEIGTRGHTSRGLAWDLAFFDAEIDNEIININVQPFPGAPFTIPSYRNAAHTRHLGIEAGVDTPLVGDKLRMRTAYTWSRFRFVDDPTYGNNYLAGAPTHMFRSELIYRNARGIWIAPNIDWSPATYFVDSANTALNDKYAVFNLKAGFDLEKLSFFLEAGNLTDRNYSGAVNVDSAIGRYYLPSNGRSIYGGIRIRLF